MIKNLSEAGSQDKTRHRTPEIPADLISEFRAAMRESGLDPGEPVADGGIHRFHTEGDRRGTRNGWYVIHDDGDLPYGAFGCHKRNIDVRWCLKSSSQLSPEERARLEAKQETDRKRRQAEDKQRHDEARRQAEHITATLPPAPEDHRYLRRKQIRPHGALLDGQNLVIPMRGIDGRLKGLEYIAPNSDKWRLKGTDPKGAFHVFGDADGDNTIFICEGFATGASLHEATGKPVICAFSCHNLKRVAESWRQKLPNSKIIIAGDNTKDGLGQRKAREAADAVGGIHVVPPHEGDDWNDHACREGLDAVKRLVLQGSDNPYRDALIQFSKLRNIAIPQKKYHLFPFSWNGCYGIGTGARGVGKTWFFLGMGDAMTRGVSFGTWECNEPASVGYIEAEMSLTDNQERSIAMDLGGDRAKPFYLISNAYVQEVLQKPVIHLTDETTRRNLRELILDNRLDVVIFDNIASLTPGIDENSKQEWDAINQFMIGLRHAGVSPWLIHHLGKNGEQRGTSGREDNIDMSIKLLAPRDHAPTDGARFIVTFNKTRIPHKYLPLIADIEMQYRPDESGRYSWSYRRPDVDKDLAVLEGLALNMSERDIAKDASISQSSVHRTKKKLLESGLVDDAWHVTAKGKHTLEMQGCGHDE